MDTIRYVDTNWHHYCKRAQLDPTKTFTDFAHYKNAKGKKYSYIQDFGLEDIEHLENKIKLHLDVADHVFVVLYVVDHKLSDVLFGLVVGEGILHEDKNLLKNLQNFLMETTMIWSIRLHKPFYGFVKEDS